MQQSSQETPSNNDRAIEDAIQKAQQLLNQNQAIAAKELLVSLIPQKPQQGMFYYLLGLASFQLKEYTQACIALEQIIKAVPDHVDTLFILGICERIRSNLQKSREYLERLVEAKPDHANGWIQLGLTYSMLNQPKLANDAYEKAAELEPDQPDLPRLQAFLAMAMNDKTRAKKLYKEALKRKPKHVDTYYEMAIQNLFKADSSEVSLLQKAIAEHMPPKPAMLAHYALARTFEKAKEYDTAFEHYQKANNLQQMLNKQNVNVIIEQHENLKLEAPKTIAELGTESGSPSPIFIIGMPRSGSSLTEQILANHSDISGAGELTYVEQMVNGAMTKLTNTPYPQSLSQLTNDNAAKMVEFYRNRLTQYGNTRYVTDKTTNNYQFVPLLLTLFPDAKIIHCVRDPIDTCWSMWRHYFHTGHYYKADMEDLIQVYKAYQSMMSHWHTLYPERIYDVEYEKLVKSPKKEAPKLLEYCGLPWQEECLDFKNENRFVNTAHFTHVRDSIQKTSIQTWKPVEDKIQPLIQAFSA